MSHAGGTSGSYEGVGMSTVGAHDFRACYLYTPGNPVGAAASASNGRSTYFCLQLSGSDQRIVNTGGRQPVRRVMQRRTTGHAQNRGGRLFRWRR